MTARVAFILAVLWTVTAAAQGTPAKSKSKSPDEEWSTPFSPVAPAASAPDAGVDEWRAPPGSPPPAPGLTTPPPPPRRPVSTARAVVPEEFNNVSVYGAPTLGQWKRGLGVYMGFPLLGARFSLGILDKADAGVAFDSMYGVMNDFRLHMKWLIFGQKNWTAAFAAEGGYALFSSPPQAEGNGARWLTGRRNWNLAPGLIVSYRGDSPHSPRLFLDARCAIAFDTQPYETTPLSGVPAALQVSANLPVRAGAEMPFSSKTSFLFVFGFDVHGRPDDSPFMIDVSVGIVTSI